MSEQRVEAASSVWAVDANPINKSRSFRAVQKLRQLREQDATGVASPVFDELQRAHPARVVLPNDSVFEQHVLGAVPKCPEDIVSILSSPCPLSCDGRIVADTHHLIFVPGSIDGAATTVNVLRDFAATAAGRAAPIFFDQKWYDGEPFARQRLAGGRWVLLFSTPAPGTVGLDDVEGAAVVEALAGYRIASVVEVVGAIVLHALQNRERLFERTMVRCAESSGAGARVAVGLFDERGFGISDAFDDFRLPFLGWAVVREL